MQINIFINGSKSGIYKFIFGHIYMLCVWIALNKYTFIDESMAVH